MAADVKSVAAIGKSVAAGEAGGGGREVRGGDLKSVAAAERIGRHSIAGPALLNPRDTPPLPDVRPVTFAGSAALYAGYASR